jgi:hypothetical protein
MESTECKLRFSPIALFWCSEDSLNTSSHSIYTLLSDPVRADRNLVGPEGFEPPTTGGI